MAETLGMDLTTVVMVSGYNLLAAGCIGPFVSAFSRKYGKRPVFLVSTLLDIIGTAVGEAKISYSRRDENGEVREGCDSCFINNATRKTRLIRLGQRTFLRGRVSGIDPACKEPPEKVRTPRSERLLECP